MDYNEGQIQTWRKKADMYDTMIDTKVYNISTIVRTNLPQSRVDDILRSLILHTTIQYDIITYKQHHNLFSNTSYTYIITSRGIKYELDNLVVSLYDIFGCY